MPIYAYKCESCGFAKDVLQKLSDAPLADCPACGAAQFRKQLTAAGFQLKGSGWYATDFKGGGGVAAPPAQEQSGVPGDTKTVTKTDTKVDAKVDTKALPKSAAGSTETAAAKSPQAASGRRGEAPQASA